jgi:hypothetical protein
MERIPSYGCRHTRQPFMFLPRPTLTATSTPESCARYTNAKWPWPSSTRPPLASVTNCSQGGRMGGSSNVAWCMDRHQGVDIGVFVHWHTAVLPAIQSMQ